MTRDIEELSAELHEVYMKEAARQGDVRHAEDYNELPERIKEFDRALARHIIAREKAILLAHAEEKKSMLDEIEKPLKKINPNWDGYVWISDNHYSPPKNFTRFNLLETINRLRGK